MKKLLVCLLLAACDSAPVTVADLGSSPDLATSADTACTVASPSTPLTVATTTGLVQGVAAGSTTAFLGIPYAAPPVGSLRFAPTQPHACWTDVLAANQYGAICAQKDAVSGGLDGDEDCLFANVWTPKLSSDAKLPVMFWVHGGANVFGSADQQLSSDSPNLYDGQALATRENVVVVSINYRLGPFGFMAHPALSSESGHGGSGNWAMLDQIAGLKWARDNVAAFGGDPSRVTLFGESAGAMASCTLMASPLASDLFSSVLMESGDCSAIPQATAEAAGTALATTLGCSDTACLRQLSAASIAQASAGFDLTPTAASADYKHGLANALPFAISIDGWSMPDDPMQRLTAGTFNKVPLLLGTNAQEIALFLIGSTSYSCSQFDDDMSTQFGATAATTIEATYPCTVDGRSAEVSALTDLMMTCPARRIALASSAASQPVYRYYYTHVNSYDTTILGAYHSAELPYVFDSFTALAYVPLPDEQTLSNTIEDRWGAFATTHAPNSASLDAWPAYTDAARTWEVLDTTSMSAADSRGTQCDMWGQRMGW